MSEIGQQMKDLMAQNSSCLAPIEANPKYTRIYEKLGVATLHDPSRMPSAAQLVDTEIISDHDIAVGLEWYAEGQVCEAPGVQAFGRIDPEFEIFFADVHAEIANLINDIVSKKLTAFGQVNARLLDLKQRERIVVTEIAANLKARLQQQNQEELAQQQQNAEELVSAFGAIAVALASRGHASVSHLASKEAALERAQESYAKAYPTYVIVHRVRAIHCDSIGRSLQCDLQAVGGVLAADPAPNYQTPMASPPVVSPDYARALAVWLEAHKVYPEAARLKNEEGRVVVKVRVDRAGHVLSYALIGSSGYADLDASVVDMMRNAVLPPFPPSMTVSVIDVTVPVRFGLVHLN